jgi:hypothetical protein
MCPSAGSVASWFRSVFSEVSVVATMNAVPGNCGSVVFIAEEVNGGQNRGSRYNTISWDLWRPVKQIDRLNCKIKSQNHYTY